MPILKNPKWELFAQELAKGVTGAEAYRKAGYTTAVKASGANASRLLKDDSVRARVDEILAERNSLFAKSTEKAAEALAIDRQWVMALLKENAERALQAIQAKDENGDPIGDFKYEGSVANRALELLGKEIGMFIDRAEIGGPGDFSRMSDDELERFIAEKAGMLGGVMGIKLIN